MGYFKKSFLAFANAVLCLTFAQATVIDNFEHGDQVSMSWSATPTGNGGGITATVYNGTGPLCDYRHLDTHFGDVKGQWRYHEARVSSAAGNVLLLGGNSSVNGHASILYGNAISGVPAFGLDWTGLTGFSVDYLRADEMFLNIELKTSAGDFTTSGLIIPADAGPGTFHINLSQFDTPVLGLNQVNGIRLSATGIGELSSIVIDQFNYHGVSTSGHVPEPSTYALMLLGLIGLGIYRKRK